MSNQIDKEYFRVHMKMQINNRKHDSYNFLLGTHGKNNAVNGVIRLASLMIKKQYDKQGEDKVGTVAFDFCNVSKASLHFSSSLQRCKESVYF